MSDSAREDKGRQVSFRELLREHRRIEVPLIQRDYVQGRASAVEVRREFLRALERPLVEPGGTLDLDFVYGDTAGGGMGSFLPLDGQQRLTTLFLLHWYAAWRDGETADFQSWIAADGRARFRYGVRPSSGDFFDRLVHHFPAHENVPESLSAWIVDQPWFFLAWRLDPTIDSVLTMLDDLHARFVRHRGLYRKLVEDPAPITFQLLNLHVGGLTDDLYIKMNARGVALTPFEIFKAQLAPRLSELFPQEKRTLDDGRSVSVREYFAERIDSAWTDLLWKYLDPKTHLFDDRFMRLLRTLVLVTRDPQAAGVARLIDRLRDPQEIFSFFRYHAEGCLDGPMLRTLIAVLDRWVGSGKTIRCYLDPAAGLDEDELFRSVVENRKEITYERLIQFHASTAWLAAQTGEIDAGKLGEWMRVIVNLSVNSTFRNAEEFLRRLRSVNALLPEADRILEGLADPAFEMEGFDQEQIREERLKAQLLLRSSAWRALILAAERHPYFAGQIGFLFSFCGILDRWRQTPNVDWSAAEDEDLRARFAEYFARASRVFGPDGLLEFPEFLWERALLAIGDYLLARGGNWSFLQSKGRDVTWKHLLRGDPDQGYTETKRRHVKLLLDRLEPGDVADSLTRVIQQALEAPGDREEWRLRLIEEPRLIGYCEERLTQWTESENRIYLLSKQRRSSTHVELFSFHLRLRLLAQLFDQGELAPFTKLQYYPVSTKDEQPCVFLEWNHADGIIVLDIVTSEGGFELVVTERQERLPARLRAALLTESGWADAPGHSVQREVPRHAIREAVLDTVTILRGAT